MPPLIYKPSAETAKEILNFFSTHPTKDYCLVGVGKSKEVVY